MQTTQEKRTQAERREEAESKMLEAALTLLSEKGLAGLKLNDIGEAAGYSRGLPAHYFGKRDVLIAKLTKFIVDRYTERLVNSATTRDSKGLDLVIEASDFYLKSVEKDPTTMCAFLALLNESKNYEILQEAILELNKTSVRRFARTIKAGQDMGEISKDIDPESQSILLLAQLRGTAAQWLLDSENISMNKLRQSLRTSLRRTLQT